ncbi:MAG TPA: hypothetical protein VN954_01345 [Ktedonobacteraceae bacterium]|nr:hypothetical protein [Ktedonobacteraceae bacterium]
MLVVFVAVVAIVAVVTNVAIVIIELEAMIRSCLPFISSLNKGEM